MSVIFDALKKIKQTTEPDERETATLISAPGKGNVLVFNKLLRRHVFVSVVILAGVVALMSAALVYIYYDEIAANRTAESAPPKTLQRTAASMPLKVEEKRQPIKAPVGTSQQAKGDDNIVVSHIAPGRIPAEPAASLITRQVNAGPGKLVHAAPSLAEFKTPQAAAEQHSVTTPKSATAHSQRMPAADKPTTPKQIISADSLGTVSHQSQLKVTDHGVSRRNSANTQSTSGPGMIKNFSPPASARREKNTPHPTDQLISQQHIKDLTQSFKAAIVSHNYTDAGKIISRLGHLLGSETTYIKNLRAFLYLQKKEPAKAGDILSSILRKDATNLEAGLNMIVVSVKEGDIKAARQRTTQLLDYYPDNPTLLHFKQQLDP